MDLTQIFGVERCSRNGCSRYTVRANGRRCPLGCCCRCHVTLLRHSHRSVSLGSTWNLRRLVELTAPLRHNPSSLLTKRGIRAITIGAETTEILTVLRPDVVDARRLIFAKNDQTPLDRWNLLRKHLKPAAKKLGLSGVSWHLLRHSHATMLDVVGTPIRTMQALLGHSAPEITREVYLHAIPKEQSSLKTKK
jgi:integrase